MSFSWSSSEQSTGLMGTFRCHCTREWTVCIFWETLGQPSDIIIHMSAAGRYNSVLFMLLHCVMENQQCIASSYCKSVTADLRLGLYQKLKLIIHYSIFTSSPKYRTEHLHPYLVCGPRSFPVWPVAVYIQVLCQHSLYLILLNIL